MRSLRNDVIRFRCSPEEREMVESLAASEGKTLSQYLLDMCYMEQARRIQSVTSPDEFEAWYQQFLDDPKRKRVVAEIMEEIKDVKIGEGIII